MKLSVSTKKDSWNFDYNYVKYICRIGDKDFNYMFNVFLRHSIIKNSVTDLKISLFTCLPTPLTLESLCLVEVKIKTMYHLKPSPQIYDIRQGGLLYVTPNEEQEALLNLFRLSPNTQHRFTILSSDHESSTVLSNT